MKKILTVLLALLMVLSLSACGKKDEPVVDGGDDVTVGGGDLIIYSPNSDALIEVCDTFAAKYGINVQVVSAGTGECLERISAEKDNPQAVLGGVVGDSGTYKEWTEELFSLGAADYMDLRKKDLWIRIIIMNSFIRL